MTRDEILFFDRLSDSWDDNEFLSTPDKIRELISLAEVKEGMNVLDLGSGTGVLIPFISETVGPEGHVLAVDISEGMLGKAKQKYGLLDNVDFRKLDFEEEELRGEYDRIFLYCVYPHLHTPQLTLQRLIKTNLKPGGKLIVAFPTDEKYINGIHRERKAESELLPSAPTLSSIFNSWGLKSSVVAYDSNRYVIEVKV